MNWIKALGIFNIIWALVNFLLFIGSQLGYVCGAILGVFCLMSGIGILNKSEKMRRRFLRWSITLGLLAVLNQIGAMDKGLPSYIRMSAMDVVQFAGIYILFPIIVNFVILTRPKVKEQFRQMATVS